MSNEATPPPKTFTQLKDDLDSFMAELDQPAAVLSNGDITHVKVVKTHQNNHSLDGVDLMADSLSSECMSRDTEADPIALEMAVGDLERTKAELTRANEKLKQQFDSLTKTYFNEKTANEQERAQFIAQLNRLEEDHKKQADAWEDTKRMYAAERDEWQIQMSACEERASAAVAAQAGMQSDVHQFKEQLLDYEQLRKETNRLRTANSELLAFKDQLADFEAARMEVERLKVSNAELNKLAADNAERLERIMSQPVADAMGPFPREEGALESPAVSPSKEPIAQHIDDVESKRLASRIQFLESMLKGKEEAVGQLEGRVEELKLERDSYREAMMKVFEDSHPDGPRPSAPVTSRSSSGLDESIRSAIGYGSESIMGAIGNLGVSAYIAGASSSLDISTGKSTSNPVPSAVSGLQEQVAELTKQLLELKHLEKNKDKIEELERRAVLAESYTKEAQDYCIKEVAAVTDQLGHVQLKCSDAISKREELEVELNKAKKQIAKDTKKAAFLTSEITDLKSQLEYTKQLVKETEARLVDPIVVKNMEDKLNEINIEKTHWQKKAQSLSKDMLRVLASVAELDEVRSRADTLQMRNEELQNERNMFREMMEAAVQSAPSPTPAAKSGGFLSGFMARSPLRSPGMGSEK